MLVFRICLWSSVFIFLHICMDMRMCMSTCKYVDLLPATPATGRGSEAATIGGSAFPSSPRASAWRSARRGRGVAWFRQEIATVKASSKKRQDDFEARRGSVLSAASDSAGASATAMSGFDDSDWAWASGGDDDVSLQ